jgi:hypothetical protein
MNHRRTCASCAIAWEDDEVFEFICYCDAWQGICKACSAAQLDPIKFAYAKLGPQHAVQARLPGTTNPPLFESMFLRRLMREVEVSQTPLIVRLLRVIEIPILVLAIVTFLSFY